MTPDARRVSAPDALDIRLTRVSKRFRGLEGDLPVVDDISFHVPGGSTTALVGPSGCGKSTVLRMVAGLEDIDSGNLNIGGRDPREVRTKGTMAVAFQEDALLPWRTLAGNIALGRRLAKLPPEPQRVADLIAQVGLAGFETRRPGALSGGMRQRAAIARALSTRPRVLLLDEPFGAVDALTRRRLNVELPPVWGAGRTTVLMVTHSVSEAVLLADRVIVFSPRPARIVAEVDVTLPHPRGTDTRDSTPFVETVRRVEHALAYGDQPPASERAAS